MNRIMFMIVLVLMLAGCAPAVFEETPRVDLPEDVLEQIAGDYPRVDGSTSTCPLEMLVACRLIGVECSWVEDSMFAQVESTTRGIFPVSEALETSPELVDQLLTTISCYGTHGAYINLMTGAMDIILVARAPSEDELGWAQRSGVSLDVQPVALDAFVFLVNDQNPIEGLGLDSIRQIFTGDRTHWSELGISLNVEDGLEDLIHTYQRNQSSGSQVLMEMLVMRGSPMVDSPDMILPSMIGPFNAISDDPLGIGYSVYFYAEMILKDAEVKMIGVDGVTPTSETIADGSYPLAAEVYVVIREDTPEDSTARYLRDWLLTEAGQAVVAESGYVPIR